MSENVFTTSNFYGKPAKRNDVLSEALARVTSSTSDADGETDSATIDASADVSHGEAVYPSPSSTGKPNWVGNCPTITPGDIHK